MTPIASVGHKDKGRLPLCQRHVSLEQSVMWSKKFAVKCASWLGALSMDAPASQPIAANCRRLRGARTFKISTVDLSMKSMKS